MTIRSSQCLTAEQASQSPVNLIDLNQYALKTFVQEKKRLRRSNSSSNKAQDLYDQGFIEDAANLGLPAAQAMMADMYCFGVDAPKDSHKCFEWASLAAQGGDAYGQHRLGYAYEFGEGTRKDWSAALKWYVLAAEKGENDVCNNIGAIYHNGGHGVRASFETAAKWFHQGSENGCKYAQLNLADCYYYGEGVSKNFVEARRWYGEAAELLPRAQFRLGKMVARGEGGPKSPRDGLKLLLKAAENGDMGAQKAVMRIKSGIQDTGSISTTQRGRARVH